MYAFNFPTNTRETELIAALGIKNKVLREGISILNRKRIFKTKENWTLLVPKCLITHFGDKENYLFGFNKVQILKYVRVFSCDYCQSLQHQTNDCPRYKIHCEFCCGDDHVRGCYAEIPTCTNCWITNMDKNTRLNT